jgi:hypothetical protein
MGGLVVPWTVLPPVRSRDFFPRVIEGTVVGEDFHFARVRYAALDCGPSQ